MALSAFDDKSKKPGAGDLEKMLGRTSAHWDDLKTHIAAEYAPLDETWNFAGAMLVLSRKRGERVRIGQEIEITVLEIRGNRVHLGFRGPVEVPIHRQEVHQRMGTSDPARYHAECA